MQDAQAWECVSEAIWSFASKDCSCRRRAVNVSRLNLADLELAYRVAFRVIPVTDTASGFLRMVSPFSNIIYHTD